MTSMTELRRLRYFLTVAEELHFGRAATRLHMTQPPLSMQIRQLEEEVGTELFVRGQRPLRLTAAGEDLVRHAREILSHVGQALESVRQTGEGAMGRLNIAFTSASVLSLAPRLIGTYRRRFPEVRLELREMVTDEQIEAIGSGHVNAGILRTHVALESLQSRLIHEERLMLALPRDHALADRSSVSFSDLANEPMVSFSRQHAGYFHRLIAGLYQQHSMTPYIVQEATQLYTVIALVAAGVGIAIVPASAERIYIEHVVLRDFDASDMPTAQFFLAWRRDDDNPALRRFLETVHQVIEPPRDT